MINTLIDIAVNFGVSAVSSNIGAGLITKCNKKFIDKVAIGFGTLIVSTVVEDICADHIKKKVSTFFSNDEEEVEKEEENGGEISE